MNRSYFLATTALEDFWDISQPMVFLGPWCKRYGRKAIWAPLGAETLGTPLNNAESLSHAYLYVSGIYERLLPVLANALNRIHGVTYTERYWRIVLGSWLFDYVSTVYDKYLSLGLALKEYPGFQTILLSDDAFLVPKDARDFVSSITGDLYNLQMYTRLIDLMFKNEFPRKLPGASKEKGFAFPGAIVNTKMFFKRAFRLLLARQDSQKTMLVLNQAYFPTEMEKRIVSESCGCIRSLGEDRSSLPKAGIDASARAGLGGFIDAGDEFASLVTTMLPHDIPISYVENYARLKRKAKELPAAKFIFSAVGWYFDELFKLWAAESMERNTCLIGTQHGGTYGSVNFLFEEEHESKITDRYYSWGWKNDDQGAGVIPFPATKLVGRRELAVDNEKRGILLTTTCAPRYTFVIRRFLNHVFEDYLRDQYGFISALDRSLRGELRLREYRPDYGWDLTGRLKDTFPWLKIESSEDDFAKSLDNCRLFVCDHLSTTFVEALSSNKPTILFWDPKKYPVRGSAQPFYDRLGRVGILYSDPQSAAVAVKAAYSDVEKWWNDVERQFAVRSFCERFGRTSTNSYDEWSHELNYLIDQA